MNRTVIFYSVIGNRGSHRIGIVIYNVANVNLQQKNVLIDKNVIFPMSSVVLF